jgi:hypothetical protein
VTSRHQPPDCVSEDLWIKKECRIRFVVTKFPTELVQLTSNRTIAIVSLLDCAFSFYQNYPCRLTVAEMEFELPCEESVFQAEYPFAEPHFRFARNITVLRAFQGLFNDTYQRGSPQRSPDTTHMDLTALDMFILIHCMDLLQSSLAFPFFTNPFIQYYTSLSTIICIP